MSTRERYDNDSSSKPDGRSSPPRPRRRKSILVDPDESPKDRERRRRSRSQSQVRLQEPPEADQDSEGSLVDGWYVHRRDGRVDFVPDDRSSKRYKSRSTDLEQKTAPRNRDFRAKRDGYESDEGETHKRGQYSDRPPRRDRDEYDGPRRTRKEYEAPRRRYEGHDTPRSTRRPSDASTTEEPIKALGAGVGAAAGAAVAATAAKKLKPQGRNRSPRKRSPREYYDRGYGSDTSRPQRKPRGYSPERSRGGRDGSPSRYQRRGSSVPPPPKSFRDDRYADDRRRPRRRDDSYPPRRDRDRDYDDRDRDRDYGRRSRDGKGEKDWKKEAGSFLVATAIPFIRKHGEKYLKDQVERRMK